MNLFICVLLIHTPYICDEREWLDFLASTRSPIFREREREILLLFYGKKRFYYCPWRSRWLMGPELKHFHVICVDWTTLTICGKQKWIWLKCVYRGRDVANKMSLNMYLPMRFLKRHQVIRFPPLLNTNKVKRSDWTLETVPTNLN